FIDPKLITFSKRNSRFVTTFEKGSHYASPSRYHQASDTIIQTASKRDKNVPCIISIPRCNASKREGRVVTTKIS
ncbi:unnamed protein product, partial [Musa hybrid cultivar]